MMGARPVAEIMYIDFTTMCMDPIVNQAAKIRYHTGGAISVPVVISTQGGVGNSNGSQHSQSLEAWFVHTPGLKVVMPSTPYDAKGLLKAAIRDDGPVIFIEHKGLYTTKGQVPEGEYIVDLGKADIKRSGLDVTIVAYSRAVATALEAARILAEHGIEVEVVDPRSLVPLDIETIISSVRKTKRVVIVHEACERAGVGAELLAQIQEKAFDYLDAPIARVTGKNIPIPFAPNLEKASIPQVDNIVDAVRKILIGGK
jgi:pyruvate/2-oxoglutarate/acetoin dehydrogenase E1 component